MLEPLPPNWGFNYNFGISTVLRPGCNYFSFSWASTIVIQNTVSTAIIAKNSPTNSSSSCSTHVTGPSLPTILQFLQCYSSAWHRNCKFATHVGVCTLPPRRMQVFSYFNPHVFIQKCTIGWGPWALLLVRSWLGTLQKQYEYQFVPRCSFEA